MQNTSLGLCVYCLACLHQPFFFIVSVSQSDTLENPTVLKKNIKYHKCTFTVNLTVTSFSLSLPALFSRMRNLLVTPLQVPLLLSPTTTRKPAGSSVGVPTPSVIHLWRNASPSRASRPARAGLYCTDSSLLTQNCCRAGNLHFTYQLLPSQFERNVKERNDQCRICIS